ncbi:hypothetical protein COCSADRAFT_230039 [Bipolaris sorokiniana ND90Pr]|uniref:Uncharacterized protein n=1 Tax=Cochliobolus sativus (strain ND90Pr / ATCC 201652) TaxID=665912 RepID=M2S268_COCSN|nr:uncharacterized protein COCSADRAFT_230039 [Bipolaris sorokiniana ND90Pr]EMD61313.1 hypothetical protein COCSADRAFT_230039 [Bipolaris sorokiniana ND90Pr]
MIRSWIDKALHRFPRSNLQRKAQNNTMVSLRPPYSNATRREFLRITSSSANGTEKTNKQMVEKVRKKVQDIIIPAEVCFPFLSSQEEKKAITLDERDPCMLQCKSANTHMWLRVKRKREREKERKQSIYAQSTPVCYGTKRRQNVKGTTKVWICREWIVDTRIQGV